MKDLYTAVVQVTSGRDGHAKSSDGNLSVPLGFPKELGGAGTATNPEQLFAAGYAACFASTLKAVASQQGHKPGAVKINAEATLAVSEFGSYHVTEVRLQISDLGLGEVAPEVVEASMKVCAYTNATRGNVAVTIDVLS